jgi:hypothetical protein
MFVITNLAFLYFDVPELKLGCKYMSKRASINKEQNRQTAVLGKKIDSRT